jgi:thiol-disulfide isomerase/thioredoxin
MSFSIGPLTVPVALIIVAAAAGVGYLVFALLMKQDTEGRKRAGTALINGSLIFLLIWKLSPLVFRFSAVIDTPLLLVYAWGGVEGALLAAAAAVGYLVVRGLRSRRREEVDLRGLLRPASLGIAAGCIAAAALFFIFFLTLGPRTGTEAGGMTAGAEPGTGIGMPAPDIPLLPLEIRDSLGAADSVESDSPRRLSAYRGRTVFLNFWATWCPPCRAEIPELQHFVDDLEGGPHRAVVLAVNLTSTEKGSESVGRFVEERDISFPVFLDPNGTVAAAYDIQSIPTTYVISPEGIIIAKKTGVVTVPWMLRHLD